MPRVEVALEGTICTEERVLSAVKAVVNAVSWVFLAVKVADIRIFSALWLRISVNTILWSTSAGWN